MQRFYSSYLGRFISADTIVPGGSPQALNRYSYVANSFINLVDPTSYNSCYILPEPGLSGCLKTIGQPKEPETLGILCGSDGVNAANFGPYCDHRKSDFPVAPPMNYYTDGLFPNYSLYYAQYQGQALERNELGELAYVPLSANGGKPWQAKLAASNNPNRSLPTNLIGYSTGADAAVLLSEYAGAGSDGGWQIETMVLIGPSFNSAALSGGYIVESDYFIDQISTLADSGTRILIYDDQNVAGVLDPLENVLVIPYSGEHGDMPGRFQYQIRDFINNTGPGYYY